MSQNYLAVPTDGSGEILTDLASILDRDEALRSNFSGSSAPSDPVLYQIWRDTSTNKWKYCSALGPDTWTELLAFIPSAGGALSGKLVMAEGAATASAATVNLDAIAGNFAHITGTTGITALTLAQGSWMLLCFDGILTLTSGAGLILNGANIVTAAGDMALFVGEGSSVTRLAGYFRANGSPLSALLAAIAALDSSAGVLVQTGAGTVAKRAIGAATSTDIIDRATGDARYQGLHALLTALVGGDAVTGIIEQTAPGTIAKRAVGVATSSSLPTRADADGRYLRQGSFNLPLQAGAWVPRPTDGCAAPGVLESTTYKRVREVLAFDGASREHSQLELFMPKSYNGGVIKYRVHWECSGLSSGDAVFGLQGAALADNETIDAAYGTAVEITDSHTGAGKRMITAWSGDVTFSGTPAGGEAVSLQFYRKSDNAADTLDAVDVQVVCVELLITIAAADDS